MVRWVWDGEKGAWGWEEEGELAHGVEHGALLGEPGAGAWQSLGRGEEL